MPSESSLAPLAKRKPGRPKGKKTSNYLTLRFWFNQLQEDLAAMKPYQRAVIAQKMMQTLMTHDRHLQKEEARDRSVEPNESDLLAQLESQSAPEIS